MGDIEAEIFDKQAPKSAAAFLKNVDDGNYTNGSFYRVLKDEGMTEEYNRGIIQGGVFKAKPELAGKVEKVAHESPRTTGLTHSNGTLSLARTEPGTASSEFFICIGNQSQFDSSSVNTPDGLGYAAFGRVVTGMKVVRKIQSKDITGDQLVNQIKIIKIKRL